MIAHVYWDGGARPTNPGHAGFGVVVKCGDKEAEVGRYLGPSYTNNYAEYMGLIVGIKMASRFEADEIIMTGDSKLVIHQIQGDWQCKYPHLRDLRDWARSLLDKNFRDAWEFIHVRGHQGHEENERVDRLCTDAIKYGMWERRNSNPFTVKALGKTPVEGNLVTNYAEEFVR